MALTYPDILKSNNPESYGIVPAKEVAGHKEVTNLEALYALAAPILSETYYTTEVKDASGNVIGIEEHDYENAIGQLWYVASEGKHYQLVDWANRKQASGWKVFKSGGGGGTIVFSGIITTEVTMETTTTTEAPSDIYYYKPLCCFIAKDASGKYYHQWSENDAYGILSQEEYGLLEDGAIVPDCGRTYQNKADDSLWIYNSETSIGRPVRPRVAYGTCSTAGNVAEKVITLHPDFADWKLEVGAEVVVVGDNVNTAANPKLNVNDTGAKPIKYAGEVITTSSLGLFITTKAVRYIYDGTDYVWMGWSYDSNTTYLPTTLGFGYGICNTDAATIAKTATLESYSPVKNGIVSIKFTNSVPANATLNINSKGAKPIFYRGSAIVAGVINAGDVATFIYDGTNYIYLGTDNALSKAGGVINGELKVYKDNVMVHADGTGLGISNEATGAESYIAPNMVVSAQFKTPNGTEKQILMADGSVAGTITTAWLEANLT